ncbi:hypothetical protein [Pseudarthrobacter sp. MDT3-1]
MAAGGAMRLTVQMDSHGFADLTKKDVTPDAGTVAAVRPAGTGTTTTGLHLPGITSPG